MTIPRFTLLQLLGAMTVCSVLFCIAAIDPVGSAVVLGIAIWCAVTALIVSALTYLVTRIMAEFTYMIVGRPAAGSPFANLGLKPESQAESVPSLAAAVESLQTETARELGSQVIDPPPESPFQ